MAVETGGHCRKCGESDPARRNGRCMNVPASSHDWVVPFVNPPAHACRHCKKLLTDFRIADGCPCNSPRGINHGLVPKECCTCKECDPAQTGSSRIRDVKPAPETEVPEGVIQERTDVEGRRSWVLVIAPEAGLDLSGIAESLGDTAEVCRSEGKKLRITIEEIA
jgi:hypothetical protein